jgi:hypothetical protein
MMAARVLVKQAILVKTQGAYAPPVAATVREVYSALGLIMIPEQQINMA